MVRNSLLALLLAAAPALAHGGQPPLDIPKGGTPGGGVPPGLVPNPGGLPTQPSQPARTGKIDHTWETWWGYNQWKYLDFRRRQKARRGPTSGGAGVRADPDAWRRALRAHLVPVLLVALKDKDHEVRTSAAVALGKLEAREAIPTLKKVYGRDNLKVVREACLQGLLLMGDPQLREFFISIVRKQGEQLRLRGFALMGLGRTGDALSRQFLIDLFNPKKAHARALLPRSTGDRRTFLIAALAGLHMTGRKEMADLFLLYAKNKVLDEEVRAYAVTCLGKVGARDRLPDVLRLLERSWSDQVRRSAAVVAGVLAGRGHDAAARALARAVSKDKDGICRNFATISLGQIGGPIAIRALKRNYRFANKNSRGFFLLALGFSKHAGAVPLLKEALLDAADARDSSAAALALGLFGQGFHAREVRKRLGDARDWLLRQTCMLSLGMLDDQAAAGAVKKLLVTSRHPPLRTAAAISYALLRQHSAVPLFIEVLLTARNRYLQIAVAQVMGFLASPMAAPPLEQVFHDRRNQRRVRAFALVALGTLADTADFPILASLAFDTNYFVRCDPLDEAVTIL